MFKDDQLVSTLPSFKLLERQNRLDAAEERYEKAEAALLAHDQDRVSSVGLVLRHGSTELMLFLCQYQAAGGTGSLYLVDQILNNKAPWPSWEVDPNGPGDAGATLTFLLAHLEALKAEPIAVVDRLPHKGSALLLDPVKQTVALYRPEDSDEPIRTWTYDGFLDADGRLRMGDIDANRKANALHRAMIDLMEPGYAALELEVERAEDERIEAAQAIKAATRPNLRALPTA